MNKKETKKRIEELDNELSRLEATYDADTDKEFRKGYMEEIEDINKELIKLGGGEFISEYPKLLE